MVGSRYPPGCGMPTVRDCVWETSTLERRVARVWGEEREAASDPVPLSDDAIAVLKLSRAASDARLHVREDRKKARSSGAARYTDRTTQVQEGAPRRWSAWAALARLGARGRRGTRSGHSGHRGSGLGGWNGLGDVQPNTHLPRSTCWTMQTRSDCRARCYPSGTKVVPHGGFGIFGS